MYTDNTESAVRHAVQHTLPRGAMAVWCGGGSQAKADGRVSEIGVGQGQGRRRLAASLRNLLQHSAWRLVFTSAETTSQRITNACTQHVDSASRLADHAAPLQCPHDSMTLQSFLMSRRQRLWFGAMCLSLLHACGGGGGGSAEPAPPPDLGAPAPDNVAPTVSGSVSLANDTVTFSATASDNVGVTEAVFVVDGSALEGTVSKSPGGDAFSLPVSASFFSAGTHSVVARVRDAAGNTAEYSPVGFEIQRDEGNPPGPPTATASVDGNFGLIRFSVVTTVVNHRGLQFLLDGVSVGRPLGVDGGVPFLAFDARGLAGGRHSVVARVSLDNAGLEHLDSPPVFFDVDASAGIAETEPNDEPQLATVVAGDVRQVLGQTEVRDPPSEGSSFPIPLSDYYKLSLPAGTSLRVDMRTNGYQFISMSLRDAAGEILVRQTSFGAVNTLNYTSGDSPQEVYVHVASGPVLLAESQSRYLLLLSYP
jgi:hypothetical protein